MIYDPKEEKYLETKQSLSLRFLYNTVLGRIILKLLTCKCISKIGALYFKSPISKIRIKRFIKKNNINMNDYYNEQYHSFNDFFIRKIKPDKRKIENGLIAISDSKLTVYKIDKDSKFNIKNSIYTVKELIGEEKEYKYALIFRLCVDDYHHYVFPDDGEIISSKHIKGKLHTVQPIAFKKYKVFHENDREITYLNCKNLGEICIVEVGALMVGKIVNENVKKFKKGDEKGHFEFGGSTIIMLTNKDLKIDKKIMENSKKDIETIVKLGETIGQ